MDVREKLVELLSKYFNIGDSYTYNLTRVKSAFACGTVGLDDFEEFDDEMVEDIASYLISHGVTVQEWISVDDRLPENGKEGVLIALRWREVDIGWCEDGRWDSEFVNEYEDGEVTHWMPLPQPPKGE